MSEAGVRNPSLGKGLSCQGWMILPWHSLGLLFPCQKNYTDGEGQNCRG